MDIQMAALGEKCDFCGECVEWCLPEAKHFIDAKEAAVKWKGTRVGSFPAPLFGEKR